MQHFNHQKRTTTAIWCFIAALAGACFLHHAKLQRHHASQWKERSTVTSLRLPASSSELLRCWSPGSATLANRVPQLSSSALQLPWWAEHHISAATPLNWGCKRHFIYFLPAHHTVPTYSPQKGVSQFTSLLLIPFKCKRNYISKKKKNRGLVVFKTWRYVPSLLKTSWTDFDTSQQTDSVHASQEESPECRLHLNHPLHLRVSQRSEWQQKITKVTARRDRLT